MSRVPWMQVVVLIFDDRLLSLKVKWDEAEVAIHPNRHSEPQVYNWILKNEAEIMRHSMLAPVCELAGLGSPPCVIHNKQK